MGASILAYIQIDDNSGEDPPFTNPPSTWDLTKDYGLYGCKDYLFIGAISGMRTAAEPLIPLRGAPPLYERDPITHMADETFVSYLSYAELLRVLTHAKIGRDQLDPQVVCLLGAMAAIASVYGDDRVRLVFAICD